jgi:hypothetical protein
MDEFETFTDAAEDHRVLADDVAGADREERKPGRSGALNNHQMILASER